MDAVRRFFHSLADAFDAWAADVAARAQRREDEAYSRGLGDGVEIGQQLAEERARARRGPGLTESQ